MSRDEMECKLLQSLRLCRGISENSMISAILPSFDRIEELKDYLIRVKISSESGFDAPYGGFDIDDEIDSKFFHKTCSELISFLSGITFQDKDKSGPEAIGLLIYCGHIDNGESDAKSKCVKVFHTFPFPANTIDMDIQKGNRFNLSFLNKNKWYTDEFKK